MATSSSRWSSRASGSTCSRAARGDPQGDATAIATCPIWIGPWEASAIAMKLQGLSPERPLTHDLFAPTLDELGVTHRPGRHLRRSPTRRSTPASSSSRRPDGRGRRAAVRCARAGGPSRRAGSSRPTSVLDQAAARADGDSATRRLENDGRSNRPASERRRSAPRRLPRLRQLARPGWRGRHARGAATGASGSVDPGRMSAQDRLAARQRPPAVEAHIRSRSRQKSRTARRMTCGLAPVARAGRARVVRDADLGDRPSRGPQLDQQLGREERAARFDPRRPRAPPGGTACRRSRRRVTRRPKKIRFASRYARRVERPDERVRPLDPVADDDVGLSGRGEARGQPAEVRHPELAVAVGEGDELVARRPEARAQRRPVAEVRRVVDGPDDVRVGGGELVGERPVSVASSRRRR